MWFKNLIFYTYTSEASYRAEELEQKLSEHRFSPCKSQELSRYGWTSPHPQLDDQLVFASHGAFLISAKKEEKIIPGSVVKESLKERVELIEAEQHRKVYRKEQQQLKDEVILDLLPRAFSKYQQTFALVVPQHNFIAVDSTNHKKAEELLNLLRHSLGTLPVALPDTNHSPGVIMSAWLRDEQLVPAFQCKEECELKDQMGDASVVKVKGQPLQGEEITIHLDAGKQVSKLALSWDETLEFMLHEDLSIKRFKPSEELSAELNEHNDEDPLLRLDADVARLTMELQRLLPALLDAFGGAVQR